jgi:hypothetical protein
MHPTHSLPFVSNLQPAPAIRQECQETQCVKPAQHFKHCSEKVEAGKGWHGEDCVEELFHLMHCVDVGDDAAMRWYWLLMMITGLRRA